MSEIVSFSAHKALHAALKRTQSSAGTLVGADDEKLGTAMSDVTPETRIASSMEDISRYIGEITQLLQDLSTRPDVDNERLGRIATAVSEIREIVPAMLQR